MNTLYKSSETLKDKDIAGAIGEINKLLNEDKFELIDSLFCTIDLSRISFEIIIALLRSSYPARKLLDQWEELLARAYDEIRSRGRNPDKMLWGLIQRQ